MNRCLQLASSISTAAALVLFFLGTVLSYTPALATGHVATCPQYSCAGTCNAAVPPNCTQTLTCVPPATNCNLCTGCTLSSKTTQCACKT